MDDTLRKTVVLVGENGCGKKSLIRRISEDLFLEDTSYDPLVLGRHVEIGVKDRKIEMYLWNIYMQIDYDDLRPHPLYRPRDVILLCFSIDSQESFEENVDIWMPAARDLCPGVPVILVGTKKELRDELLLSGWYEYEEPVTPEQGRAKAEQIGAYAYVECSAKTNEVTVKLGNGSCWIGLLRPS